MGGASYTIYLSHTILYKVISGLGAIELVRSTGFPPELALLATVGVICAVSAAFYAYVERPVYGLAKSLVAPRLVPRLADGGEVRRDRGALGGTATELPGRPTAEPRPPLSTAAPRRSQSPAGSRRGGQAPGEGPGQREPRSPG
jgi:hypothetical protein